MEALTACATPARGVSTLLQIDEPSQIGGARRCAVALGSAHALDEDALGRLALVVTETATNVLLHGGGGAIVLRPIVGDRAAQIEVLALDKGPGIPDLARAMQDGYSTKGTRGQGLGGIKRLAESFDIHSLRGAGTVVMARVGDRPPLGRTPRAPSLNDRIGVVSAPLRSETECGDAWHIIADDNRIAVVVADGLGHGPEAAAAAAAAITQFTKSTRATPGAALAAFDAALRGTRGAAVSVAIIDQAAGTLSFSGVGNVDGRVFDGMSTTHLVPTGGIVGHSMPALRPMTVAWPRGARLVMHSDGISARWRMEAYPGLRTAHPALLAGAIYRDFGSTRDDVTVLVLGDEDVGQAQ